MCRLNKRSKFLLLLVGLTVWVCHSNAQVIDYTGKLKTSSGQLLMNKNITLVLGVYKDQTYDRALYMEKQSVETDEEGIYHIRIGGGDTLVGSFGQLNWSDGDFFVRIVSDSNHLPLDKILHSFQLRRATEIRDANLEGIVSADSSKAFGQVLVKHNKGTRPKKVTVDLTSAYVNIRYPGGTYPVYRHFEWWDEDADGRGNAFTLTYSDHTNHAFNEQTNKMGDVKLYPKQAFQELYIRTSANDMIIDITKPVEVSNQGETYAMKGPWKLIYLMEW